MPTQPVEGVADLGIPRAHEVAVLVNKGLDLIDLFAQVVMDEAPASNCRSAKLKTVGPGAVVVFMVGLRKELGEFLIG